MNPSSRYTPYILATAPLGSKSARIGKWSFLSRANAAWHQAPVGSDDARSRFAAHLQVLSVRRAANKLKYLAGTESGMGVWINDIVPEEAALRLREA